MTNKKLFISASSKGQDYRLAEQFYQKFAQTDIQPFLARESIGIGKRWSDEIEYELENSDYFLLIISENALMSDMITEEVRWARRVAETHGKTVDFFPVRIQLPESAEMTYELGAYLNRIQQKTWNDHRDTQAIFNDILKTIYGGAAPVSSGDGETNTMPEDIPYTNIPLEYPEGSVSLHSNFYVTRDCEDEFIRRVEDDGALLRIRAPRQFGKTSLMIRIIDKAKRENYNVIAFSMQRFARETVKSKKLLMSHINRMAAENLNLPERWSEYAMDLVDVKVSSIAYWENYILKRSNAPILLAIDEADLLFKYEDVSNDFFGLLRLWHENARQLPYWPKLRIVIAYSTDAMMAMNDINQSPFNVGQERELQEFSIGDIYKLAEKHNNYQLAYQKAKKLHKTVGGHPYLTRIALYMLARREYEFNELIEKSFSDNGPFGDHLRKQYLNLIRHESLMNTMKSIIQTGYSYNPIHNSKLRAAGLIKGDNTHLWPSCEIYRRYFENVLL